MNPAAVKANIDLMDKGTIILVNSDAFEDRNLAKAGYAETPYYPRPVPTRSTRSP